MYFTYYSCYSTNKPIVTLNPVDKCFPSESITSIVAKSPKRTRLSRDRESMAYDYYDIPLPIGKVVKILNGQEEWQDEDYTFIEVERVYSTRIDCNFMPEGVRQAS